MVRHRTDAGKSRGHDGQGELQPPGGLAEHQGGGEGLQSGGEGRPPRLRLGDGPGRPGGADRHDTFGLGHMMPTNRRGGVMGSPPLRPVLRDTGSIWALETVRAAQGLAGTTHASWRARWPHPLCQYR
jgi:hypothetical protein